MKDRIQRLFAIKPEEEDDGWSEEEAEAAAQSVQEQQSEPGDPTGQRAAGPHRHAPPAGEGAFPASPSREMAPRPPQRPGAPSHQRRPTNAMQTSPEGYGRLADWQARLRRSVLAERER